MFRALESNHYDCFFGLDLYCCNMLICWQLCELLATLYQKMTSVAVRLCRRSVIYFRIGVYLVINIRLFKIEMHFQYVTLLKVKMSWCVLCGTWWRFDRV